jgi:hypothetical protein
MPRISNLTTKFGVTLSDRLNSIRQTLKTGGLAIPLVHTNTLYDSKNPVTDKMLHAVVLADFNENDGTVRVIDPSPGFSHMPVFEKLRDEQKLKIRANSIRRLSSINAIAEKFHPLGSIDYVLPMSRIKDSLRSVSTTIEAIESKK